MRPLLLIDRVEPVIIEVKLNKFYIASAAVVHQKARIETTKYEETQVSNPKR